MIRSSIVPRSREHPMAFLGTPRRYCEPLDGPWRAIGLDQPVSIFNLGPLRPEEARALAAGFAQANESRLTDCLERAAGNPLFLVQLLQNATESALAVLPGSISSLVLARIDRLDALDNRPPQAASILGQQLKTRKGGV